MKKQLLLLLATICCFSVNAQDCMPYQWAKQAGGTGSDFGQSVSTDTVGNVYVTGWFNGTASFGTTTLTSAGNEDIFIAKYDASGNVLWAKQAGGTGWDYGRSVSTDILGNTYITGYFDGTAWFGTTTLTSLGNNPSWAGNYGIYIAKLDANGNFLWVKQAGGAIGAFGYGVSSDALGNTYIIGQFSGTAPFGTLTLISAGSYDIYIAKLDANGSFLWAKQAGGTSGEVGYGISTDVAGNAYITGAFDGTAAFGTTTLTSAGNFDIFIAKLDANGSFLWAKQAGGIGQDIGYSVSSDGLGNAYVTGYFYGTTAFGTATFTSAGNFDIFIAKLDANGNFLWVKQAGGTGGDGGYGVSTNASGNTHITGYFSGTAAFGTATLTSAGNFDIFIAKLDANGNFLWAKQAGGTSGEIGYGISTDTSGNAYITGYFFNGTAAFGTTTLTSAGNQDIFIAKLSNVSSSISVNSGSVCAGSSFTITPSGASTYTITGGNFTVNPNNTTSYSVTGIDANGCVSANAAVTEITVHALPILNVTGGSTICVNESANLTVNGANTYTWSTNENDTNISVSPSVTTNYSVQGMDNNGCSNSTNVTVNVDECLGIGELKIENEELKIYPNPVSSVLNVEFLVLSSVEVEIKVIDVLGREILIKQLATRNGTVQINVSEIPKGIYFIKIGNETRKFVKE